MFPFQFQPHQHHNNSSYGKVRLNKQRASYHVSFRCLVVSWMILFLTFILFLCFILYHNTNQYDKTRARSNEELVDEYIRKSNNIVKSLDSKLHVNVSSGGGNKNKLKTENNRGGMTDRDNKRGAVRPQPETNENVKIEDKAIKDDNNNNICLTSITQLSHDERHPIKGKRHTANPPSTTNITLVCCQTTVGPLSIAVHSSWAPIGAERFLSMVQAKYFQSVALFRCIAKFICQFGLAGTPEFTKRFDSHLKDEPNWLPEGVTGRKNSDGVKRFAKGYLAYAGGGINSRSNQLIVALDDNQYLGGGSPWEVPWGEVSHMHFLWNTHEIPQ